MPKKLVLIVLLSFFLSALPRPVLSAVSACSVTVTPQSYNSGGPGVLTFGITNNDDSGNAIKYIKISSPSSDFTINSGTGSYVTNSSVNGSGSEIILVLSGLAQGEYAEYYITVTTGDSAIAALSFGVQVSDVESGEGATSCQGDTGVAITSPGQQIVGISNTTASVNDSSATIRWTTDQSTTGEVYYGSTNQYGNKVSDSNLSTLHSITISGLTPSTTYHFKIRSIDVNNNDAQLIDNTFTTAAAGITTVTTNTVTTTTTVVKAFVDTTPPSIRFTSEFKKLYEEAPLVGITAADGTGIAKIEYSTNGGKDWTSLDLIDNFGDKKIITGFTPNISDDGDYSLIVKVIDTTGNKILSKEVKFIIDRLPPRVGPIVVMAGPLIISQGNTDNTELLAGVEYRFIISSAGGPNSIKMVCGDKEYDFTKNEDVGVWSTKVKFDVSGECVPTITAVDGAGNKQEINEDKLVVNELGKLINGTITVYWYDDFEKKFVVWDGEPYGQVNPINTNKLGGYGVLLPQGKYYLEAKSLGKRTTVSNIIDITETAYINDSWELSPVWKFWQLRDQKIIKPKTLGSNSWKIANFELPKVTLNKAGVTTLDIRGKVSIVSIITSWHPLTNEFLKNMDELYKNKVSVYPILLQEKESAAISVRRRGGYETSIYSDKDGELLKDVEINGLPTTWIVNRFGKVIRTKVGIVSPEELLDELSKVE